MGHPQCMKQTPTSAAPGEKRGRAAASHVEADGTLVEMTHDADVGETAFAVGDSDNIETQSEFRSERLGRLRPFSPVNSLIAHNVVLFPSGAEEYGSKRDLLRRIQSHIHEFVDLSPLFERLATYYVLLSWLYDCFQEVPYLRVIGDPGTGKTRFLRVVGSLCYRPIFASGASTTSPVFRMLDTMRGTLVLDEADFRRSDEKSQLVKILNNGIMRGFPVLRTEQDARTSEYSPRAYHVFGPKIVATRQPFSDPALESRFISERTGERDLREDIPISLPRDHDDRARALRNQLLLFRFRERARVAAVDVRVERELDPRLSQMFSPLLAIIDEPEARREVEDLARSYHDQLIEERGLRPEAQLLRAIRDLVAAGTASPSVGAIAERLQSTYGAEFRDGVTPRWVGQRLRSGLGLRAERRRSGYVIPASEAPKLARLWARYGIATRQDVHPLHDVHRIPKP